MPYPNQDTSDHMTSYALGDSEEVDLEDKK